jgi:hypothetical protein
MIDHERARTCLRSGFLSPIAIISCPNAVHIVSLGDTQERRCRAVGLDRGAHMHDAAAGPMNEPMLASQRRGSRNNAISAQQLQHPELMKWADVCILDNVFTAGTVRALNGRRRQTKVFARRRLSWAL